MASWQSCIAKYLLAIWRYLINKWTLAIWWHPITKHMLAVWRHPITKHTLAILATSYRLNKNVRVSSFYWTRGSKLCFLTCFSYFSHYFLILVFLRNCYLLISLRLSWLQRNPASCPVFLYHWQSKLVRHTCAPIFLAQNPWVSWSKALVGT